LLNFKKDNVVLKRYNLLFLISMRQWFMQV